jgi:protein-S-isoprenylcysteine O-methyltransferase Ste14
MTVKDGRLGGFGRLAWLLANLLGGVVPSALFFAWVERNCSLPYLPIEWGWPWLTLATERVVPRTLWNAGLILAFGALHTALAQPSVHRLIERVLPPQATRSLYLVATGVSLLGVMGCWQHTGLVLWVLPWPPIALAAVSAALYLGLFGTALWSMRRLDGAEFLGFRQLYLKRSQIDRSEGTPVLIRSGWYGRVRHPIYLLTLLAFAMGPFMTLDRATVFLASAAYLAVAIPIEERKLILLFGDAYRRYRREVPAILPRF